jgi:hypothetical protein
MSQAPPSSPTPSPGQHDRTKLLEAYQNLVRSEQEKRQSASHPVVVRPPSRAPFWVTMSLLIVGLSSVLVLQPAWLFPQPVEETPALKEASLRVRMFVEIDRIEQFRSNNGRLPASLREAKADSTGLQYRPQQDAYSVVGRNGPLALTYTSTAMAPRDFLGQSYQLILMRNRP